MLNHSPE